jgi:GNAT superfamily N-acetyltransferase
MVRALLEARMTDTLTLPIRPLLPADLPQAHGLTAAIRWPHRLEDWQFALSLGEGFAISDGSLLLGTAMAWQFGPEHGCFGMLIVAESQQGRGLGARLTDTALSRLGTRSAHLVATKAGEKLYYRLGFEVEGTIRQHQGIVAPVGLQAPRQGERLRPGGAVDLAALATLDMAATGMDRTRVLAALLNEAETIVLDREGMAAGFAMLRPFGRGHVIGPVVAPDEAAARLLIAHFLGQNQGRFIRIDVTDFALCPWLEAADLACVDEALCMVRGSPAERGAVRRFALVNQALG